MEEIPEYVSEWIGLFKSNGISLRNILRNYGKWEEEVKEVNFVNPAQAWAVKNPEKFLQCWLQYEESKPELKMSSRDLGFENEMIFVDCSLKLAAAICHIQQRGVSNKGLRFEMSEATKQKMVVTQRSNQIFENESKIVYDRLLGIRVLINDDLGIGAINVLGVEA